MYLCMMQHVHVGMSTHAWFSQYTDGNRHTKESSRTSAWLPANTFLTFWYTRTMYINVIFMCIHSYLYSYIHSLCIYINTYAYSHTYGWTIKVVWFSTSRFFQDLHRSVSYWNLHNIYTLIHMHVAISLSMLIHICTLKLPKPET